MYEVDEGAEQNPGKEFSGVASSEGEDLIICEVRFERLCTNMLGSGLMRFIFCNVSLHRAAPFSFMLVKRAKTHQ
jgi:hypothetical protein